MYLSTGKIWGILGFAHTFKNVIRDKLPLDYQEKLGQDLQRLGQFVVTGSCPFGMGLSKSDVSYVFHKHNEEAMDPEPTSDEFPENNLPQSQCFSPFLNIRSNLNFKRALFTIVSDNIEYFELKLNERIFIKEDDIYMCSFIEKNTFVEPIIWQDAENLHFHRNIYFHKHDIKIKDSDQFQRCKIFFGTICEKEIFQSLKSIPEGLFVIENYDNFVYLGNYVAENTEEDYSSKMSLITQENHDITSKTAKLCNSLFEEFKQGSKHNPEYIIVPA
jgi:hypothetical protein